jgi:hypothetical protein
MEMLLGFLPTNKSTGVNDLEGVKLAFPTDGNRNSEHNDLQQATTQFFPETELDCVMFLCGGVSFCCEATAIQQVVQFFITESEI